MSRDYASTIKDDVVADTRLRNAQNLPPLRSTIGVNASNALGTQPTTPTLNRKQQMLQGNIEYRKQFDSMVLQWQEILCDPVSVAILAEAANRLKQSHYQEVIEERNIVKLCGYPICHRPPRDIKGKFRISLQERKVYDISVLKQFCSSTCLSASRFFETQMTEEPLVMKTDDPERLKEQRIAIIPLDMELSEYNLSRANNPLNTQDPTSPHKVAFNIPSSPTTAATPGMDRRGSTSPNSSTGINSIAQSIMATVPATPSYIKIVERDPLAPGMTEVEKKRRDDEINEYLAQISLDDQPKENAEQLDSYLAQLSLNDPTGRQRDKDGAAYEIVEGFRVPVAKSKSASTSASSPLGSSKPKKPSTFLLKRQQEGTGSSRSGGSQQESNEEDLVRQLAQVKLESDMDTS